MAEVGGGGLGPVGAGRSSVADEVHRQLWEAIVDGALAPGERLREIELAGRLEVSRTPVREALGRLEAEGLAAPARGRGLVVSRLEVEDLADLGRIRVELDGLAGERAAEQGGPGDWAAVHEQLGALEDALASRTRSVARVRDAHRELHRTVYRTAFTPAVAALLERNLLLFLERSTRLASSPVDPAMVRDHRALVAELSSGDPARARLAAVRHASAGVAALLALAGTGAAGSPPG